MRSAITHCDRAVPTDSRLLLDLSRGVYVVAATVPPATVSGSAVTATGEFTINVKIPAPHPDS